VVVEEVSVEGAHREAEDPIVFAVQPPGATSRATAKIAMVESGVDTAPTLRIQTSC